MDDSQTKATLITVGICFCIIGTLIYLNETHDHYTPSSYSDYESRYIDSIYKSQQSMLHEAEYEKNAEKLDSSIKVIKYYTEDPNSAGGVDVNIVWKNTSKKTVKYARFRLVPYNRVDDIVSCSIRDYNEKWVKAIGPIKPGQITGYDTYWETLWYNHSIAYMKINSIEIEYMDGTIIRSEKPQIIKSVLPNKSK